MKNKLLLIFDMDGTILKTDHETIPQATLDALSEAKKQNHIIAIATGRPLVEILKPINNANALHLFDFLIANNGTYYYDVNKKETVFDLEVPHKVVQGMSKLLDQFHAFFAIHDSGDVLRVRPKGIELDDEMLRFNYISLEEAFSSMKKVTQCSTRATKEDAIAIKKIMEEKFGDLIDVTISNELYTDVIPKGVSKYYGIKKIQKITGISNENTVGFGDSGNDKEMIENVGYGIAMGNATKEAKDVAKEIIGNNDSDAIGQKVYEILGGK